MTATHRATIDPSFHRPHSQCRGLGLQYCQLLWRVWPDFPRLRCLMPMVRIALLILIHTRLVALGYGPITLFYDNDQEKTSTPPPALCGSPPFARHRRDWQSSRVQKASRGRIGNILVLNHGDHRSKYFEISTIADQRQRVRQNDQSINSHTPS